MCKMRPVHYYSAAAALLAIYLGSYIINSACGGYWLQPERDGVQRWVAERAERKRSEQERGRFFALSPDLLAAVDELARSGR